MKTLSSLNAQSISLIITDLDGRDKAGKLIQYAAKFVYWYFSNATAGASINKNFNAKPNPFRNGISARAKSLMDDLSQSRKSFRIFKSIVEYRALMSLVEKEQQQRLRRRRGGHGQKRRKEMGEQEKEWEKERRVVYQLQTAAKASMILFYLLDTVVYFVKAKVLRGKKWKGMRLGVKSNCFYLLASLCNFATQITKLYFINKRERRFLEDVTTAVAGNGSKASSLSLSLSLSTGRGVGGNGNKDKKAVLERAGSDLAAVHSKREMAIQKSMRYLMDSIVGMHTSEIWAKVFGREMHDGFLGALGAASAGIAIYHLWLDKTAEAEV